MDFKVQVKSSVQVKPAKKFIILAFREYTKAEWEEFDKWGMTVYEYTKDSANGRSMAQLLEKYDVVIIDMIKDESFQFYALSRGDPELESYLIHVSSLCSRRRSERDCQQYGIQSQLKKFLSVKSLAEFLQYLIIGDPKKARPEWVDGLIKLGEGCVGFCR